jgi:hypothetical protein
MDFAVCTIISKNHLPFARVFAESYKKHNKGDVFLLLVDRIDGYFDPTKEDFKLFQIEEFRDLIPGFDRFCFRYDIFELNCAMKPYFIDFLFKEYSVKKLLYFDSDVLVTGNMGELLELLNRHPLILTPHLTAPLKDGFLPGEIEILRAGLYNMGFFGISNAPSGKKIIEWWKNRLYMDCINAVEKGLFADQKWMDLAPCIIDGVLILKEPEYNIAYWNFHCRELREEDGRFYTDGRPAVFFHLSGLDPENIQIVSKHQNRFQFKNIGAYRRVLEQYQELVLSKGWNDAKGWPYAFDRFDNGIQIPPFTRRLLYEMGDGAEKFGNPFETDQQSSFFNWLNTPFDPARPEVTRWSLGLLTSSVAPGVEDLLNLLNSKEAEKNAILNSLSWKVTLPLRKAVKLFLKKKNN